MRSNRKLIERYRETLAQNRAKLPAIARRISALAERQSVVCWGGGRILDALVRFGGLDATRFRYVIDAYLSRYMESVHGAALKGPEHLRIETPDVVLALAKSASLEIEREARRFGIRHVVKFQDLLEST